MQIRRAGVLGVLIAMSAGVSSVSASTLAAAEKATVGLIELEGTLSDRSTEMGGLFGGEKSAMTLRSLVSALQQVAARDDLDGLMIRLKDAKFNTSQIEELGAALKAVRASGKKVHLYAYGYDNAELILGSYVDEVIVQKGGAVSLPGMHMEEMFLADTLAWAGAKADFVQVGDYKGASEMMVNSKPSPQWEQNINGLLDGLYSRIRAQIKAGRKMDDAALDAAMSDAFFGMAEQAKKSGLIDSIVDLPELTPHLKASYGKPIVWEDDLVASGSGPSFDPSNPLAILQMFSSKPERKPTRDTIAVVHIDGAIVDGDSTGGGPFGGEASVGSLTIRRALSSIEDSKHVKGVIVRISSPGGSAIASEVIWQGLQRLREKGKPVWISVGSMAASGGYYILAAGDQVYVNPSSIVGSIGVVGGKIALGGVAEKLKVNIVERNRGPRAGMMSSMSVWTDQERALVRQRMTETYDLFTSRVTAGRKGIDLSKTAEGRLFTGEQAIGLKMADKLGGLDVALADLQAKLGLEKGEFDIFDYPAPRSFEEMIQEALGMAKARVAAPAAGSGLIAEVAGTAREVLGPVAFEQLRQQMAGLWQLRSEPVVLISPRALIFR
jgi:protease IV